MDQHKVILTLDQMLQAAQQAQIRYAESRKAGLSPVKHGLKASKAQILQLDYIGLCGEIALAAWIGGRLWAPAVNSFKSPDVHQLQVRTTPGHNRRLIVRPDDGDDDPFVLVTSDDGESFWLRGWLFGHEAKQDEFKRNPNGRPPAWFVPPHALRPIEGLLTGVYF